jgi:hypothetical protein
MLLVHRRFGQNMVRPSPNHKSVSLRGGGGGGGGLGFYTKRFFNAQKNARTSAGILYWLVYLLACGCTTSLTYGVPHVALLGLYPPCSIAIRQTGFLLLCPRGLAAASIAARLVLPSTPCSSQLCIVWRTPPVLPLNPNGTGAAVPACTLASGTTATLCRLPPAAVLTHAHSCA